MKLFAFINIKEMSNFLWNYKSLNAIQIIESRLSIHVIILTITRNLSNQF